MQRRRLAAQELPEVRVLLASAALDEIRRERQRRAAEADQRDLRRQFGPHDPQRVADERRDVVAAARALRSMPRERSGFAIDGPGLNVMSMPSASSGVMMSLKMIAASSGNRRSGCSVISAAIAGVRVISRNDDLAFTARYSGR